MFRQFRPDGIIGKDKVRLAIAGQKVMVRRGERAERSSNNLDAMVWEFGSDLVVNAKVDYDNRGEYLVQIG